MKVNSENEKKSFYNSEFVKKILQGDKDLKEGKGREKSPLMN